MRAIVDLVRRHPVPSGIAGVLGLGLAAWLFFGVFAFHLAFVDDVVDEADPFAAGPGASGMADDALSEDLAEDMNTAMSEADVPMEVEATEDMPMEEAPDPESLATGSFIDRSHATSGSITVLTDGMRRVLRIEGLRTDNGPDLNVYLSSAPPDAGVDELGADVVDLGDLKGNIGDQNYDIPDDVDLDRYSTVVIWCVRFSVAFGAADLS